MNSTRSAWFAHALTMLIDRTEIAPEAISAAIREITSGAFDESEAAAFLVALRMKGETASDIGAAVQVLRERMVKLTCTGPVLDTCGTGGDGSGTFNISTAVAMVVAATGCAVVKHGNRSVSSRSGSADVLEELGVPIDGGPAWAQQCLDQYGFAFCFAPHFHPALAAVAQLRRKLGVRTIFNLLGPLLNPASAEYQLLGVGKLELLDPLAGAVSRLGVRQAFLVCGEDGLDEVTLGAPTQVRRVRDGKVESLRWDPSDFGLKPASLGTLKAGGPSESAGIICHIFEGQGGPEERIVLANAAAALLAAERVDSLPEGVECARQAIQSGAAARLLEKLSAPVETA